jgi:hypothetical protein
MITSFRVFYHAFYTIAMGILALKRYVAYQIDIISRCCGAVLELQRFWDRRIVGASMTLHESVVSLQDGDIERHEAIKSGIFGFLPGLSEPYHTGGVGFYRERMHIRMLDAESLPYLVYTSCRYFDRPQEHPRVSVDSSDRRINIYFPYTRPSGEGYESLHVRLGENGVPESLETIGGRSHEFVPNAIGIYVMNDHRIVLPKDLQEALGGRSVRELVVTPDTYRWGDNLPVPAFVFAT